MYIHTTMGLVVSAPVGDTKGSRSAFEWKKVQFQFNLVSVELPWKQGSEPVWYYEDVSEY